MRRCLIALLLFAASARLQAQAPPNIVLMDADNLGFGEVGVYGSVRGVPTPRIDALAGQGLRLTNFNVETFCTPSRTALLTGRYGIRSGTLAYRPPVTGMTLWEVTIAEVLKPLGYATAAFGKWHVGDAAGRAPTHQGFDEWYGIRDSSNESQHSTFDDTPHIWEGKAGQPSRPVKEFNVETRATIDREVTERTVDFMKRSRRAGRPFFAYVPFTLIHFPTLPHPDFAGKTGAGDVGDAMAEMDRNVGAILDAIAALGIERDTIVIWASDGGAEARRPWRGTAGPWSGFYNTAMEGGIRTPFMIRWPGRIPAGRVSNEIVHGTDILPTLASAVGAAIPRDRAIDGINQLPFFEGKQQRSNRESFLYFAPGSEVRAVKWGEWKLHYVWQDQPRGPIDRTMRLFNLRADPREDTDIKDFNPGVIDAVDRIVADFWKSVDTYPLIPVGAPDPYVPAAAPPAAQAKPSSGPAGVHVNAGAQDGTPSLAGKWKRVQEEAPPPEAQKIPATAASGWGDEITIAQDATRLTIERAQFSAYDMQPPMRLSYALDGSESRNVINIGRGPQEQVSRVASKGGILVISTRHGAGTPLSSEVTYEFSLDGATLVIEMTRPGGAHPSSTTRARYKKVS